MLFTSLVLVALIPASLARQCRNITIPIDISAQTAVFALKAPRTQLDVTRFVLDAFRQGSNYTQSILTGYKTTTNSYNISAQYCQPDAGQANYVQVLTHGVGFDKGYWDIAYNNYNYSYVNSALAAGYSTLAYDRLGISHSSHGDPINEIQFNLELAALRDITTQLRKGSIREISKPFGNHIVHVGHSFGSEQSFAFSALYPNETAGLVLTGFTTNGSFGPLFMYGAAYQQANQNQPVRLGPGKKASQTTPSSSSSSSSQTMPTASPSSSSSSSSSSLPDPNIAYNYPDGYLTNSNLATQETLFFAPDAFDPALLRLAEHSLKQPVAVGELLTNGIPASSPFRGPVLVITGDRDLPFCGGDCYASGVPGKTILDSAAGAFEGSSKNFTAYVQPRTGHGINAHYNSTGAYAVIQGFLKGKGLS